MGRMDKIRKLAELYHKSIEELREDYSINDIDEKIEIEGKMNEYFQFRFSKLGVKENLLEDISNAVLPEQINSIKENIVDYLN